MRRPRLMPNGLLTVFAHGLLCLTAHASDSWPERVAAVARGYDIAETEALVDTLRTESGAESALAEALLTIAELHRIAFESVDESERAERRSIGNAIDEAADEALALLENLPESSHQQRLMADLLGVKIRSNYQAKKYRKRMETAAAKAIELDPDNAAAYVSASKSFLYADEDHRGDLGRAIELLEQALARDPDLEKAHLLIAYAWEQQGDVERAIGRLEAVLERNPNCRPARDALARLRAEQDA